ncbi:MAG: hypothetical protein H7Y33_00810 [Cytophagales bacterium]|nr:hypothetical protein [Rhizobacter sp.]
MGITMQGSWTLRVKSRNAAYAQRFIVCGATTGNGTYDGIVGNAVFVTGAQWSLQVQHQPTRQPWRDSAQRLGLPAVEGGVLRFQIASNDGGLDDDYDDLVLAASLPASQADHVVYGNVKTYSGACLFNPGRDDYLVIDPPFDLVAVCARCPQLLKVIETLYPERLRAPLNAAPDLTPIVIPTGLPNVAVGLVFQSRALPADAFEGVQAEGDAVSALQTAVRRVPFKPLSLKAGVGRLAHSELKAIANIRDAAIRQRYQVEPAPGLLLRFQRYTRTPEELSDGGSYTGAGARQHLGQAVTDEQGNYLFRFRHEPDDAVSAEVTDPAQRPDLIVQVLSSGLRVRFETAPYDNVANLRRIDLCVPASKAHTYRALVESSIGQSIPQMDYQRKRAAEAALSRKASVANSGLDLHVHAHAAHPAHATHAATASRRVVLGGLSDHGFGRQHQ